MAEQKKEISFGIKVREDSNLKAPFYVRCNHHKHDWWPSPQEQKADVRFLNCCHEIDYGEQLFEDEKGAIIPRGPAATYHQRMLKLNRPDLVRLRIARRRLNDEIESEFCQIETEFDEQSKKLLLMRIDYLKLLLDDLIPEIPPPPSVAQREV